MNTRAFIRQIPALAWLIMFTALCAGIFPNLLGSLAPEISTDLNLLPSHIGWMLFIGSAGSAVGAFLGGDIVHRVRPTLLVNAFLICMCASIALMVGSSHFFGVILGFFVYEIMITALFTLAHTLMGQMDVPSAIRARLLALLDVGFSIGASIAPLWVMGALLISPNWRLAYTGFIVLIVLLLGFFNRQSIRADMLMLSEHANQSFHTSNTGSGATYLQLLRTPWVLWAWIAGILVGYVEWGHSYWFVNYAHLGRAIDLTHARWGLLVFTLGMATVRALQAFVHSQLTVEQRLMRLALMGCVMYVAIALYPTEANLWYILLTNYLAGLGIGVVFPILLNHLIDYSPRDTAKFSALLMLGIIIGMQLGSLIIGYTSEHFGMSWGYATVALAMMGFTFSAFRVAGFHRKPRID